MGEGREIKFRVWDKKQRKMYLGDIRAALTYPQEDIVIMQYTGLKDTRGRDIYEDDIVNHPAFLDRVEFRLGMFTTSRSGRTREEAQPLSMHIDKVELVGNVHEDPERLK